MPIPMYQILNARARHDREWEKFREWERLANDHRKRSYADDRGKLRVPSVEDNICQQDGTEPEQPLDGKLSW